jgi:hypothetical protein
MKLDLFKTLKGVNEDDLHPKFKLLRDNIMLRGEGEVVMDWTDEFIDRDNKIIKEFQTSFHSSFWEFYLFRIFRDLNFDIDFSKDRPDFIITAPEKIFIEAVVANVKKDGREEKTRNIDDILSMIIPPHKQNDFNEVLVEAIVRNSNAIIGKSTKYLEKYVNCDWVDEQTPFVIALSSYDQVNYGREHFYPMFALLYGFYFDPKADDYEKRDSVIKPGNDTSIPLGIFDDNSYQHISAIIFSCTVTLGKLTSLAISSGSHQPRMNGVINIRHDYEPPHYKVQEVSVENPEYLSDSLYIFHNPFAKSKLEPSIFENSNVIQVIPGDNGISFIGENLPIYSRLNISKFMINPLLVNSIMQDFNTQ